jgi:hypothetical protein
MEPLAAIPGESNGSQSKASLPKSRSFGLTLLGMLGVCMLSSGPPRPSMAAKANSTLGMLSPSLDIGPTIPGVARPRPRLSPKKLGFRPVVGV